MLRSVLQCCLLCVVDVSSTLGVLIRADTPDFHLPHTWFSEAAPSILDDVAIVTNFLKESREGASDNLFIGY